MSPNPATNPSPYPQTGSIIEGPQGKNRTGVALSTMIVIKVNGEPVGAIKKLSVEEQRTIEMIDEVGTDGHIDSAPNKSAEVSGSCDRVRYDRLRIAEAFKRGFVHVKSQRIPFDIEIIDLYNGDENSGSAVVTVIKNVWIKQISYSYDSDNWIISESMQWVAESISSRLGNSFVAVGGERNITPDYDSYELAADMGIRRGSLDAPGLISGIFLA